MNINMDSNIMMEIIRRTHNSNVTPINIMCDEHNNIAIEFYGDVIHPATGEVLSENWTWQINFLPTMAEADNTAGKIYEYYLDDGWTIDTMLFNTWLYRHEHQILRHVRREIMNALSEGYFLPYCLEHNAHICRMGNDTKGIEFESDGYKFTISHDPMCSEPMTMCIMNAEGQGQFCEFPEIYGELFDRMMGYRE